MTLVSTTLTASVQDRDDPPEAFVLRAYVPIDEISFEISLPENPLVSLLKILKVSPSGKPTSLMILGGSKRGKCRERTFLRKPQSLWTVAVVQPRIWLPLMPSLSLLMTPMYFPK